MEKNTVVIDIETYNKLRDFSIEIRKKGTIVEFDYHNYKVYTENEAVEEFVIQNTKLKEQHTKRVNKLIDKIHELEKLHKEANTSIPISTLSEWSIWKFWNWKSVYNNEH